MEPGLDVVSVVEYITSVGSWSLRSPGSSTPIFETCRSTRCSLSASSHTAGTHGTWDEVLDTFINSDGDPTELASIPVSTLTPLLPLFVLHLPLYPYHPPSNTALYSTLDISFKSALDPTADRPTSTLTPSTAPLRPPRKRQPVFVLKHRRPTSRTTTLSRSVSYSYRPSTMSPIPDMLDPQPCASTTPTAAPALQTPRRRHFAASTSHHNTTRRALIVPHRPPLIFLIPVPLPSPSP
ncbi:hypothetical protein D9611_013052 [Ephemerocybe angulata]|uniref:Uncharacterized protein n=1 Tax=Ephemerocybe angulata TaxID=980116 RepID=A0A8H5AUQ4_9AGAR|nr:hypothetical protein D9611_013052 [Tulosesus angulatus]